MAPSSLYAAIKLARLVQRVKDHLKSCIKKCTPSAKPADPTYSIKLNTHARKTVCSAVKSQSRSPSYLGRHHTLNSVRRRKAAIPSLLDELGLHANSGDLNLAAMAAQDRLFLHHDSHLASLTRSLENLYDVLDLTTALLDKVRNISGSNIRRKRAGADSDVLCDDFKCEKFVANLEHLLRCLKQNTVDAIIHNCLSVFQAHILHWHHYWQYYWQHQKRIDEGWFCEWPNGQRPLNTTWPWNVKPSLLVLWGVCWMFYGSAGHNTNNTSNARPTRNRSGTDPLSEDFRTRQHAQPQQLIQQRPDVTYEYPRQPRQQVDTTPNTSQAWAGPLSNTYPKFSWLHPQQAGPRTRRANDPGRNEPGNSAYSGYGTSVAENPYIIGTSTVSSDLFPTASSVSWPYSQGLNQDPPPAYAPSYIPWQSPYNPVENLSTTAAERSRSDSTVRSYGPPPQVANPQAAAGSLSSLGFGLGLQMPEMQSYPSPHSAVSEQTTSSCLSVLPGGMMSPSMVASPSVAGSSNSRHSSRRSQDPPRNVEGMMYCDHPECADHPPVFLRKCEWSKHMDKHIRPYVCEEPGCENIRGFTYSGGLSRHQREVHRQHGGPKASCHCPHKDCKRSTGVGFSRKENLHEHLRRVHRDSGADQKEEPATPSNDVSFVSRPRKRRRAAPDDEEFGGDLEQEVKKLRRELQERDERLKKLEEAVARLTGGQQK